MKNYGFALVLVLAASAVGYADCISSRTNSLYAPDVIQLAATGFSSTQVTTAINWWNSSTCNPDGTSFPYFREAGGSDVDRVINVSMVQGSSSSTTNVCGLFSGNDIFIFTTFRDSATGQTLPCPGTDSGIAQTIAHELGHVLGLNDVSSSSCGSYIMSKLSYNTSTHTYNNRYVHTTECSRAAGINDTTPEQGSPDPASGPIDPTVCHNCGGTMPEPLILDLAGDGLALTGPTDRVFFDIDGDGRREWTTWTAQGSDDAFLVLNKDNDRSVAGAVELFGSATAGHSFEALAQLDWRENGGNDDGVIDHQDRSWSMLRLWVDRNHNGVADDYGELSTVQSHGILRLDLEYSQIDQWDAQGNRIDFRGSFVTHVGPGERYWDMFGVSLQAD